MDSRPEEYMIVADGLTKKFDDMTAVDRLDLKVRRGEIFGFLGPNGAGKTTSIRMFTTLVKPTSGKITVNGYDTVREQGNAKKEIGIVQQHISLDRDLTVEENISMHARIHRIPKAEREPRIKELLEEVGMYGDRNKMINKLSGGMKRKVMILCALAHHPKLLFLDEPTVGLDTHARRQLWDLIRDLNAKGTTIFLTTHYIEEAEALCDRVGIMNKGRMAALDTPINLRKRYGMAVVEKIGTDRKTSCTYFENKMQATKYVKEHGGADDTSIVIRDSNLEDVFVELTGEKNGITPGGEQ